MSSHSHSAALSSVRRWLKPLTSFRKRLMRLPHSLYSRQIRVVRNRLQAGLSTLPVELLEIIFQIAASESYETALNLFQVSSAVKKWTAPMLYHTVHLQTARHAQLFQRTTDHLIPSGPSFLATNVRYIVLHYRVDDIQDVFYILRACTGIIGLAHEAAVEISRSAFIHGISDLSEPCTRLTHLVLHIPVAPRTEITFPYTLTHLSLNIEFNLLDEESLWGPVRDHFPPLTHLMVGMKLPFYLGDTDLTVLRVWVMDLPSSLELIVVRLIFPEGLALSPAAMPGWAYHTAYDLHDLPNVAILFSKNKAFELYNPLEPDSQHVPTIVYHDDRCVSWLKDDIWEVAESVLLSRRSLD